MPNFDVNINVGVNRQPNDLYGVDMTLKAKATRDDLLLFNVELVYGGAFLVKHIPGPAACTAADDREPAAAVPVRAPDSRQRQSSRAASRR